jgi:hypothetical protein
VSYSLLHPFPALLALFFSILVPQSVYSGEAQGWLHEIRAGVLDHDTDNLWSDSSREDGIDFNAELVFAPSLDLWHGTLRPNLGVSINDRGNTSKMYTGGVWQYLWRNGLLLDLGLGLAIHDGETDNLLAPDRKQLGSSVLFHVSAEIGYCLTDHSRLLLMFDHVSNGYTVDPNEGLDTLGIRYGYLF